MATFDVCASVDVTAGGSFQWSNTTRTSGVKVTPVTSWPLPQSEYDILAGGTTSPISIPSTTPKGVSYQVQVKWMLSTTPGLPCPVTGGNPKIIVGDTVPSFGAKLHKKKKR